MRQVCPGLLLATSQSQCHVSHAGGEFVAFHSSPQPQRHLSPSRSSWPYLPGARLSLWHADPDTLLPHQCINKLSLSSLPRCCQILFRCQSDSAAPAGKRAERYHQHHLFHELIRPRERREAAWSLLAGAAALRKQAQIQFTQQRGLDPAAGSSSVGPKRLQCPWRWCWRGHAVPSAGYFRQALAPRSSSSLRSPHPGIVPKWWVAGDRCGPKERDGGVTQRDEKLREIGRCPQDPR